MKTKQSRVADVPDFDHLAAVSAAQVEHQTILEFLRTIPHKFQPEHVERFGDKVKRMANALQLAFVPSINPRLGVIRTFPVPLLQWVYSLQAAQFGWPAEPLNLEDGKRKRSCALRQLDEAVADAPPAVRDALKIVVDYLECVTGEKSAAPDLRPV